MLKEMLKKKKEYYKMRVNVFEDYKDLLEFVDTFDEPYLLMEVRDHVVGQRSDHKECTKEIIRMSKLFLEISKSDNFEEIQNMCHEGLVEYHER
jgi:hypothetical protein